MTFQIDHAYLEGLGGEEALTSAVAGFAQALVDHATTVDVPAPTAHPLVEEIVRRHGGEYEIVNVPEPPPEPDPVVLTMISKDAIWRRATDVEAEQMEAALQSQPVRLRRIYEGATFISTADELYGVLEGALVALFGAERAAELLEPTG